MSENINLNSKLDQWLIRRDLKAAEFKLQVKLFWSISIKPHTNFNIGPRNNKILIRFPPRRYLWFCVMFRGHGFRSFCTFSLRFDETSRDFVLCRAQLMFLKPNRFTTYTTKTKSPSEPKAKQNENLLKQKK